MRFDRLLRNEVLISFGVLSILAMLISGQKLFLFLFLIAIGYGIFREGLEGKIKFLLFFCTWIYVLKLEEGGFSFFHLLQLIYLMSCAIFITVNRNKINIKVLLGFLFFVLYILFNFSINASSGLFIVLGFVLNFFTITVAFSTIKNIDSFNSYVLYYTFGLSISGIVAMLGEFIPQIKLHIQSMGESFTVYQNDHLYMRFSGLDIDPNYFAFQVLFGISLLIVISGYKKRHLKENFLIFILVFMGINTLSKMFLILLILIISFICAIYIKNNIITALKFSFVLMISFLVMLPLGFINFIKATLFRFSLEGSSTVSITTGRSDLWLLYIREILSSLRIFLVGNGFGSGFLGGYAAHNMYLLYCYFLGFIGILILLIFIFTSYRHVKKQVVFDNNIMKEMKGFNKLPLFVLLISNFSLDSVMMDYFPLFLFLTVITCNYFGTTNDFSVTSISEINQSPNILTQ
ncbi:hypothetical protein MKY37_16855 [Psychrobacillus sp. FSL K6-2836]|uniref:hypothetical protein n=1 Tax=Psychrobacillus sp. FSL K6-2836 TaxID=2921548 RepID=UPI0030FA73C8